MGPLRCPQLLPLSPAPGRVSQARETAKPRRKYKSTWMNELLGGSFFVLPPRPQFLTAQPKTISGTSTAIVCSRVFNNLLLRED